jgi:hypothetical protein
MLDHVAGCIRLLHVQEGARQMAGRIFGVHTSTCLRLYILLLGPAGVQQLPELVLHSQNCLWGDPVTLSLSPLLPCVMV